MNNPGLRLRIEGPPFPVARFSGLSPPTLGGRYNVSVSPSASAHTRRGYDVPPDGQRFLMLQASEQETAATQLIVVQNWFEELKRRVPAKK